MKLKYKLVSFNKDTKDFVVKGIVSKKKDSFTFGITGTVKEFSSTFKNYGDMVIDIITPLDKKAHKLKNIISKKFRHNTTFFKTIH